MTTDTKAVARWDVQTMDERTSSEGRWVLFADHELVVGEFSAERLRWFERAGEYLKRAQEAEEALAASRAEVEALREAGVALRVAHPGMVRELRRMSKRLDGEPVWIEPAEANLLLKLVDAAMENGNV